jgi:TolB-like protein
MSLFAELKRRNVIRVAVGYLVLSWLVLQIGDVLIQSLELSSDYSKFIVILLALGAIPALVFSWIYEMTPEGIKKESEIAPDQSVTAHTAKKLDLAVIVLLVMAMGMFAADRFMGGDDEGVAPTTVVDRDAVGAVSGSAIPVVAVLPLQALSTEDEGIFLATGLHDDLLTRLARLEAFRVISRTSVMEYANTTKNMRQIGEELGAGYILEGGLQAIGGRVRINAQLIEAETDEHLWAETFDRELTTANLFDVQAEIAAAIAAAMHLALTPKDLAVIGEVPTENLEAYEAYLETVEFEVDLDLPTMRRTLEGYQRVVALDPDFADAWARLSLAQVRYYWETGGELGSGADTSFREDALRSLERAKALAPSSVQTLRAEAFYHYYGFRDYSTALIALGRAEAIAPNEARVIALRGFLLRRLGRFDESADALILAQAADPRSSGFHRELIGTLWFAGRCSEALDWVARAVALFPEHGGIRRSTAWAILTCTGDLQRTRENLDFVETTSLTELNLDVQLLVLADDREAAIDLLLTSPASLTADPITRLLVANRLFRLYSWRGDDAAAADVLVDADAAAAGLTTEHSFVLGELAALAAAHGDAGRTRELIARAEAVLPDDALGVTYRRIQYASVLAEIGDISSAVDQLERANQEGWRISRTHLEREPAFDPLRGDPRFQALLNRESSTQ